MKRALVLVGILSVQAISLAFERPKIVSTSPPAWATGVPPATQKTVSVTFDQKMRSGFWDFLGRDTLSPSTDYHVDVMPDLMSFSMRVRLEPGKVYVLGLNEKGISGVGFQSEKGISAAPTFIVFQTAGTPVPDDAPPRVLTTTPTNGAPQISPTNLKAVTITFDKAMQPDKHGLHMLENKKDIDLSKAKFQYSSDGRTFTLGYEFKASSTYEFELNSTQDIGFASTKRVPLWPVRFAFTTSQPQ